jgi:DNA-binding MarR family transcriptional regulator
MSISENGATNNIIRALADERNQLYAENCELREALAEEQENKPERYELKIQQLELERMWWENLMKNDWLSGNQKLILYAIRHIIQTLRYDWGESTCESVLIYNTELMNKTGLSEDIVTKTTKVLDEVGLIEKKTVGKGKAQRNWYTLNGSIKHSAENVKIAAPSRNHGGQRTPRCERCGCEDLETTAYKCRKCGHEAHI